MWWPAAASEEERTSFNRYVEIMASGTPEQKRPPKALIVNDKPAVGGQLVLAPTLDGDSRALLCVLDDHAKSCVCAQANVKAESSVARSVEPFVPTGTSLAFFCARARLS